MATAAAATGNVSPEPAIELTDWGVIEARGDDAAAFLDGQLTQRVPHGVASQLSSVAALAGYCSPKGRLLATFVVWQHDAQAWRLACSADLLPATLKRLQMYVLRARCRLRDVTAEVRLRGRLLQSPAGTDPTPAAPWAVERDGAQLRIALGAVQGWQRMLVAEVPVAPAADGSAPGPAASDAPRAPAAPTAAGAAAASAPARSDATPATLAATPTDPAGRAHWDRLEVASGIARIVAATADRFVPQMVNLDAAGGLNFQKGCYPGQEVVARSQYRGTVKRRAFVLQRRAGAMAAEAAEPADPPAASARPAPGDDVTQRSADGTAGPVGTVVLAAGDLVLAELQLAAVPAAADASAPLLVTGAPWTLLDPQPLALDALE